MTIHTAERLLADIDRHYAHRTVRARRVRALVNPSIRAIAWVRLATESRPPLRQIARSRLIHRYGIDVGRGARIGARLALPHPLGIVIGAGARIGDRVTVYHNVTLGRGRGGYPHVEDGVTIFPGAVVVGGVRIGREAVVGANAFVAADVSDGQVVRGGERWV